MTLNDHGFPLLDAAALVRALSVYLVVSHVAAELLTWAFISCQ